MQDSIETVFRDLEDKIDQILQMFDSDDRLISLDKECNDRLQSSYSSEASLRRLGRVCLNMISELQQRSTQSEEKRSVSPWETDSVALSRSSIWAQTLWGNLAEALGSLDASDFQKARRRIIMTANALAAFAACMERLEKAKNELKDRFSTPS